MEIPQGFAGPNASNARQGIKTHRSPPLPTAPHRSVQTPPMPDRALRRGAPPPHHRWGAVGPNASNARQGIKTSLLGQTGSFADNLFVQTPPMPDRALRRGSWEGCTLSLPRGPNASNARQGIKTYAFRNAKRFLVRLVQTPPMPDRALRRTKRLTRPLQQPRSKRLQCPTGH